MKPVATKNRDYIALHDGTLLVVHSSLSCIGPHCVIHNPSAHPLSSAPLHYHDTYGLFSRVCPHGELHPDPDALDFARILALFNVNACSALAVYDGWHPCCEALCCERSEPC